QKQLGNFDAAQQLLARCLEIDPLSAVSMYEMGRLHYNKKDLTSAALLFTKAVDVNPQNKWYKLTLADVFQQIGKYDLAAALYEELRAHQGEMSSISNINVMVAQLEAAQKDFEDTKRKYDQAKELRKDTNRSATQIKPDLLNVINNQLVPYYSGMVQFRDEAFKNIADSINGWIVDANNNAKTKK
ncbi:MAG: tetratricopeptide repeat protein, partial [Mangrovibacterium sp.]